MATGKLELNHEVTDTLGNGVGSMHTNNLEYLPDGQAWLVRSNFVIDRQNGATLMQIHPLNPVLMNKVRVLPNDLVLMAIDGQAGKKSAITTPFDRAADKLLTMAGNQLTPWDVPAFKAVYETGPNSRGLPALSENRQWLAVCNGTSFDVLEATTGVSRGRIAADGDSDPKQNQYATAAFSPDGTKLAGVVATRTGWGTLVVCDLTSGKIAQTVQTLSPLWRLQWCGVNHLLQDSNLVDLQAKMVVWNYTLRGASVRELIDERYWHVEDGPGARFPASSSLPTFPMRP